MIPAADFNSHENLMKFTFNMMNICPQNVILNQKFWAKFESWIRLIYEQNHAIQDIEIITGPAYLPKLISGKWIYVIDTIGEYPKLISIPSHFFKIIKFTRNISINKQTSLQQIVIGCFLIPNESIDDKVLFYCSLAII